MLMTYDLFRLCEVVLLTYCTDLLHQYDCPYDIRSLLGK